MDEFVTSRLPEGGAGWIAIGLSDDVPAGCVTGVVLAGRHLALWRDGAGEPHLWEDRCPHRGMRMSLGFVRGNDLACLYHGWRFDGAGQCRQIPAHPELKVSARICMKRFDVAERGGMLWGWNGRKPATEAPDVAGSAAPVRSIHADVPVATMRAMLEDGAAGIFHGLGRIAPVDARLGLYTLPMDDGRGELRLALQPAGGAGCAVHAVLRGDADASLRAECARRMGWLRDTVERGHDDRQGADT
ncbi:hypothetical protein JCM25156A_22140 [Komagataeibacter kakiaceti JCM 25156]